eukprot:scaffold178763_cov28-Prasinocladus_malaysianus.AAC.2
MGFLTTHVSSRVPVELRSGPAARGRTPVSVAALSVTASAAAPRHTIRSMDVAQRKRAEIVSFPGEDAPGTGKRVLPPLVDNEVSSIRSAEKHRGLSTEEYYARFPSMARASCPLAVSDTEDKRPLEPPCGPGSGNRTFPEIVFRDAMDDELLHEPTDPNLRVKTVRMRHGDLA